MDKEILQSKVTAFWLVIAALFVCFMTYIYFVNTTIANIVERKKINSEFTSLTTSIGDIESEYLKLESTMTKGLALSLGFKESHTILYIDRDSRKNLARLEL